MLSNLDQLSNQLKPRFLSLVFEQDYGFIKNGNSSDLGGKHDRELLIWLRGQSDIIVTTAKTAEAEQYSQPSKPLVLITSREQAAPWLEAKRLRLESSDLRLLLQSHKVLFETGPTMSRMLFNAGYIDSVVIHHDRSDIDGEVITKMDIALKDKIAFHDRFISVYERRGS